MYKFTKIPRFVSFKQHVEQHYSVNVFRLSCYRLWLQRDKQKPNKNGLEDKNPTHSTHKQSWTEDWSQIRSKLTRDMRDVWCSWGSSGGRGADWWEQGRANEADAGQVWRGFQGRQKKTELEKHWWRCSRLKTETSAERHVRSIISWTTD